MYTDSEITVCWIESQKHIDNKLVQRRVATPVLNQVIALQIVHLGKCVTHLVEIGSSSRIEIRLERFQVYLDW